MSKAFVAHFVANPPRLTGLFLICSIFSVGALCLFANHFDLISDLVYDDNVGGTIIRKSVNLTTVDAARDTYAAKRCTVTQKAAAVTQKVSAAAPVKPTTK